MPDSPARPAAASSPLDAIPAPAVTSPIERTPAGPDQNHPHPIPQLPPSDFIARWKNSGGAEIANSQSFLKELYDLIGVPHPEPTQPDEDRNTCVFEKAVKIVNGDGTEAEGRLDLYRNGSFVLESKQGTERREAEADEALTTVTKAKKRRKRHADRWGLRFAATPVTSGKFAVSR